MILLYTGANSNNAQQTKADKSLGNYVSSTSIPNARIANLFPTLAKSDILEKRSLIRMIALKNITGGVVNNVRIYTNSNTGRVKLKIAAVAPALDGNNNPVFESVYDGSSLPYQATLDYHEGDLGINDSNFVADRYLANEFGANRLRIRTVSGDNVDQNFEFLLNATIQGSPSNFDLTMVAGTNTIETDDLPSSIQFDNSFTLVNPTPDGNPIVVGSMQPNDVIGIWILREVDESKFPELNTQLTGQALSDLLEAAIPVADETVTLTIKYS